jgi:hypothetical protein
LGSKEGFPPGKLGNLAGSLELAAFGSAEAVSFHRSTRKLRINGANFVESLSEALHGESAMLAPERR